VSAQAHLTDEAMFEKRDGKHFCSVIKIEVDLRQARGLIADFGKSDWTHVEACALPPERPQLGPSGALMLFFPCGPVNQVSCLSNLFQLFGENEQTARLYEATRGDLPTDATATTTPTAIAPWQSTELNSTRVVATAFYSWLRSCGVKPRIDATMNAMNNSFNVTLKSSSIIYEFDATGNLLTASMPSMPFPMSVLSDRQLFVESRSDAYSICCYDNVWNVGTIRGGKHAGQPLAGDPINWCELPYFQQSPEAAKSAGKAESTGLTPVSLKQQLCEIPGGIPTETAAFTANGRLVSTQPRKSYYSGGLAVELSISAL
jgi:hypothetical protein